MRPVEIIREVKTRLGNCPNCNNDSLEQRNSYRIRCKVCGYDVNIESASERYAILAFALSILGVGLGILIGSFLV